MATVAETLRLDGELASQLLARLPYAAAGLLVVLIGGRSALLVADLAGSSVGDSLVGPSGLGPTRNVVDVPSILRANLFGQSAPAGGANAPITSLRLVLGGVIASSDEKLGVAMISTGGNDVELKYVGDMLPGGARLHAVHQDRVLIDRGGTIEALLMPELTSTAFTPPPTAATAAISVDRVQQVIRGNPGIIGQVMHRTPVFADGRLRGMRVSPGPNTAAFARLGLRNNDLVTAINGVELTDQTRSQEVFDSLATAAEARVTVERNNMRQDLVLNLAEIANDAEQIAQAPPPPGGSSVADPESAR